MAGQMSPSGAQDQARRLAARVGLVIVGMAVVLGVVIQYQPRDPGPPEDLPPGLAFLAAYVTTGLLALIGAIHARPAIVVAAGLFSLAGSVLSVATIAFAVPGVVLMILGFRMRDGLTRSRYELVIVSIVAVLVGAGGVAPFVTAQERCWQATKSSSDPPAYTDVTVIPCTDRGASDEGGQTVATGSQSVLTPAGGLLEAAFLIGALTLTAFTGRGGSTGAERAIKHARPV